MIILTVIHNKQCDIFTLFKAFMFVLMENDGQVMAQDILKQISKTNKNRLDFELKF